MEGIELTKYGYYAIKNMPTEEELSSYYAEKYYQDAQGSYELTYSEAEIKYFRNKLAERVFILERNLPKDIEKTFLDIGCGEGWALKYFKQLGWNVLGLDFSSYGCEQFNPDCADNLLVGNVYENMSQLVREDKKYGVVWLDNVLEHVTDPEGLIQRIQNILAPGGILVIEVPNDFSFIQQYALDQSLIDKEFWVALPDHLSYFNKSGLNNLMEVNGYETLDVISDYPIDVNLLNPNTNYVMDKSKGKSCHLERVFFDNLIHEQSVEQVVNYYRACAELGLGRQITGFYKFQ